MFSKYCSDIADEYGIKIGGVNKLVPNLTNKSEYVVHYKNLQLHLSLGMKLTKVHRILEFKQSDWLKKYIDFSTDKRTNAANSFERDFFKLMDNSVFGKAMENLKKRISVELINNAKDYIRCVSKPSFVSLKIFSKNFLAIHKIKPALTLNKPIYVGFSILDLRKLLMYEFHYKYIKSKFDTKLLFTNTDSLVYDLETGDVYEDFYQDKSLFGFSEFVGLKLKMYSLISVDDKEVTKAKGVNKKIRHKEFVDVLLNKEVVRQHEKNAKQTLELVMSIKYHYHVLMIKDMY